MKNIYTTIILLLCVSITQAQTFEFSVTYVGINGSTNNYQLALLATPSSTIANGITADMGAGFYIPTGLTISNLVIGNSGLPTSEWSVQSLGTSNSNGDPYFVSRVEAGGSSIELNGDGPFELVLFDIISDPNPISGNITFVENGDSVFNEILFIQNYININLGARTIDAYNQNNPAANSFDFSTLSTTDFEALSNVISIYPNPTSNILNIEAKKTIDLIEVNNLLGQQMLSTTPNNLTEEIDMSSFNTGIYLVKVTIGEQSETYKVLKQ